MSQPLDLSQLRDLSPEVVKAFAAVQFEFSVERSNETTAPVLDMGRGTTMTGYLWTVLREDLAQKTALRAAVLAGVPLPFALDLDAGAVDQQVQRPLRAGIGDVDLQGAMGLRGPLGPRSHLTLATADC
jgi:hypothetical protein